MNSAQAQNGLQLPEPLRERFQRLQKRLWRVDIIIAICGALSGLILSYILLFVSDRFWDTPRWLRTISTSIGVVVLIYFVLGWVRLWIWKRRDYRALSRLVQRHYRRLGDRLLGIVELADENKRPPNISPALCTAAINQVSKEAVQFDFRQAVATRKPKIYFISAVFLLGLLTTPWVFAPDASLNALTRWLRPVSKIPRYTFVSLDQLPASLAVPHGEPFEIRCGMTARSFWKPTTAHCQFEQQPPIQAPIRGREVIFRVPGQTKPGQLVLHIGDVSRKIRIEPTLRPALKKMVAQLQFPPYLMYPTASEEIRNGVLSYVEGSQISFQGTVSRPLAMASLSAKTNQSPMALEVRGSQFLTGPLKLEGVPHCSFTWRDQLNLDAAGPWPLSLLPQKDAPPTVECPDQPAVIAILEEELVDIKIGAQDDFGVRQLGLAWEAQKRSETNRLSSQSIQVKEGAPQAKTLASTYRFSPSLLHIPPDTVITLRGTASDYYPNRKPAESPSYKIFVLSREEHAKLIEQQFENIAGELEELTRRQEGLQETTRDTRNLPPDQLANKETGRKLGEQAAEQKSIGEKLSNIRKMTEDTLREALRNKTIPSETLQQWSSHLEKMRNLAQQKMPQAAQTLGQAQQQPKERPGQMDRALEMEQKIVQELQEMQKNIGKTLDMMIANTLAQRLRKIAGTEKNVGDTLQKVVPDIIGLSAENVPAPFREKTTRLAFDQDQAGKQTRQLTEEISRFHDRTGVTNYGNVAKEMKETEAADGLARNAELIRNNIAMQAIQQTGDWAKRFTGWAEQLEAAQRSNEGGNGNGSGQGQVNEAALRRLLALLRLRLDEMNIRDTTRWLEDHKQTHPSYKDDSIGLSLRQSLLVDQTEALDKQGKSRFLYDAGEAMQEADNLLRKPQTDKPTVNSETDAINLLEAEIMDMMQQSNQSQAQFAAMAQMMQMMGMQANPTGGGYYGGGEAAPSNSTVTGDPRGNSADPRRPDRTAGRDIRSVPAEFRDALQNYFKALEQLNP